jgi:thioredoxin-dependent peroxiredoxin
MLVEAVVKITASTWGNGGFPMRWFWLVGITLILLGGAMMFGVLTAEELKVGDYAPDFSLAGSDGKTYNLSDYRDKQAVVLAWFPRAFTPGCTTECRVFAQRGEKLQDFDVAYFTASVDSLEKNKKFAESVGADYPILSDPGGHVAREYGAAGSLQKWASRWTYYIGIDGRILYIDKYVRPSSHADDVAAKLKELRIPKRK